MELAAREVLTLAFSRRAPAMARRAVREFATSTRCAEIADTAELLASELVTNAVTHGHGKVTMLMESDARGLEVTVCDDNPTRPAMVDGDPFSLGGRGLHLVELLADAWGVTPDSAGPGKGVWFRLA